MDVSANSTAALTGFTGVSSDNRPDATASCWDDHRVPQVCYDIWRDFYFYSVSIIMPLGLVFNSVSFGVFLTSWMRRSVPGCYFMSLALADNLVLTGEFLLWLNADGRLGIDFMHNLNALCKLLYFLRYGARIWSSWVTVAITIERFLTVSYPFQVNRLSSPGRVFLVVTLEALLSFSLATFPFFTVATQQIGNNSTMCFIRADRKPIYTILVMVIMGGVGELVLPSIIVLPFTVLIIKRLFQAHWHRAQMVPTESMSQRRHNQPTIALVIIALTFVLIRLPYLIMFFINEFSKKLFPERPEGMRLRIYALYRVSQVLAVANYAINFFLFCVSGNTFRVEVLKCLPWRRRGRGQAIRGRQSSLTSTQSMRDSMVNHTDIRLKSFPAAALQRHLGSLNAREPSPKAATSLHNRTHAATCRDSSQLNGGSRPLGPLVANAGNDPVVEVASLTGKVEQGGQVSGRSLITDEPTRWQSSPHEASKLLSNSP